MTLRWDLRGPVRFIEGIADDINGARASVVHLPRSVSAGELRAAVASRLPHLLLEHVTLLPGERNDELVVLARALGVAADSTPGTPAELLAASDGSGTAIWVDGGEHLDGRALDEWLQALNQLANAPDLHAEGLPVVLVTTGHSPADRGLRANSHTSLHRWQEQVSRLDVAVLVHETAERLSDVEEEQLIEVAAGDLVLAETLAAAGARRPDEIADLCLGHARGLGLQKGMLPSDLQRVTKRDRLDAWARGALTYVDGAPRWDGGLLVMEGRRRDVDRRIWTAQVRVLLPKLDFLRVELIDRAVSEGLIARWQAEQEDQQLEFKDLHKALSGRRAPRAYADLARWLRRSRNELAHLATLTEGGLEEGERLATAAGLAWQ